MKSGVSREHRILNPARPRLGHCALGTLGSVWGHLRPRLADQEPGRPRARRGWDTAGGQWSRRAKNCVRGVMNYYKQRGRPTNPPRPQARVSRDAALSRAKRRFAQCRLCLIPLKHWARVPPATGCRLIGQLFGSPARDRGRRRRFEPEPEPRNPNPAAWRAHAWGRDRGEMNLRIDSQFEARSHVALRYAHNAWARHFGL